MTDGELLAKAMDIINEVGISCGNFNYAFDISKSCKYCMLQYGGITVWEMLNYFHDSNAFFDLAQEITVKDKITLMKYGWTSNEIDGLWFEPVGYGWKVKKIPKPIKLDN